MREFKKKNGGLLCVHSIHLVTWIYEKEILDYMRIFHGPNYEFYERRNISYWVIHIDYNF